MSEPRATVCLDHAATTPMYPEAVAAMTRHLTRPGSQPPQHSSGRAARRAVEEFRETITTSLNARPGEVVCTSGGTESDNLAVKGIYWSRQARDARRTRVLSTTIKHHAVLDAVRWLEQREGADVELLPVNRIRVHSDAVQAVGQVPVDFGASGVDALTFTAHKLGGPYGVSALVARRELGVTPLIHGASQQRDTRSGSMGACCTNP